MKEYENQNENIRLALKCYSVRFYDWALEYCNEGLKEEPENFEGIFLCGQLNFYFGKLEESMAAFSKMIEHYPFCDEAFYNRGNIRSQLGDYVGAILDYDEAIRLNPKLGYYYQNRAICKCKKKPKDLLGAFADLTEAIELSPWNTYARLERGLLLQELGEYDYSVEDFFMVEEIDEHCISATLYRGVSLALSGKVKEGLREINLLIKKVPAYKDSFLERGRIYRLNQDHEKALADFTLIIDQTDDKMGYLERGKTLLEIGNCVDAMIDFNNAIKKDLDYALAYLNLGIAKAKMKDHEGAIEAFDKAIEIDQYLTEAWKCKKVSMEILGNFEGLKNDKTKTQSLMN